MNSDVDVRYLNDESNVGSAECAFRGPQFVPPFDQVLAVGRERGISNIAQYQEAFKRGYLPKGSPYDPSSYNEWTSWADFTGIPSYHSDTELYNGLIALALNDLALLPKPELRRFLLSCEYWASICAKAAGMGISEKDIPSRIKEIAEVLSGGPKEVLGPRLPSSGGSAPPAGICVPDNLTLAQKAHMLVQTVTAWLPTARGLQQEIITGFYCNAWEILDRRDASDGDGFGYVQSTILDKLIDTKPQLVKEFMRQYEGALSCRGNGRNWMQAYSLWYAQEHRRFINWSSAGLGKTRTVPAIVSKFDIRFTVMFSPKKITNEKNPQLPAELLLEDPTAIIHYSDGGVPSVLEPGKHHYFVSNSEKLQMGEKTRRMVDALKAHNPGMFVFDEGHLLVSCNLVDPELGEAGTDAKYKPRMEGLRYLLNELPFDTRIIVLTGTPVRVDAREGQALFELLGEEVAEEVGEFDSEMSEFNALRLRGQLQQHGFQFLNYGLPELRRYIYPFKVPQEIADALNKPGISTLAKEVIRMEFALKDIFTLTGKIVINTEKVKLSPVEANDVLDDADKKDALGVELAALAHQRFPVVRLCYEPVKDAVNPVFFTYFVDGPTEVIEAVLTERNIKYKRCTGDSDDAELAAYITEKDSSLIASSSWSVGVDGSQKVSNALVTLGIPWHDSGHRQTVARIQRQGAETPDGVPTTVIHEIIPVAVNVAYDVKRLNNVYARRTFTEVLSLGDVDAMDSDVNATTKPASSTRAETKAKLKAAIAITDSLGEQIPLIPITPVQEELGSK